MSPTRRDVLAGLAAGLLLGRASFASAPTDRRFVLVVLRGGLDGLAAIPVPGDPAYTRARGGAAVDGLPLDGTFALHPSLAPLKPLWDARELALVHAIGASAGRRSHFDAQDMLENGTGAAQGARDGWLNRALSTWDGAALAVGKSVPLVLRGAHSVASVDPTSDADPEEDFLDAVADLYRDDAALGSALVDARMTREMFPAPDGRVTRRRQELREGVGAAVTALTNPNGPSIAVLEAGGWDTHANQAGVLERRLAGLAEGLVALRTGLGDAWARTAVVVVTEFGRTVAANGTGGTDHGSGGAALLLGGAIAGGRAHGDWPGLRDLHEGRDLRVATDVRAVFKAVLRDHLGVSEGVLEDRVFPGSADVPALDGIITA